MTNLKKNDLHLYLTIKDYKRIEKEATHRNLSLSKTARDCLLEYFDLREELATAIDEPGNVGDPHTGKIIHTLLSRTEERIAATIERQAKIIDKLQHQVMVLTAMMDRQYLGMMQHLPEVPDELAESAIATSKRRHHKWLKAVEDLLEDESSVANEGTALYESETI